jgi:hypothetical protein
MAVRLAGDGAGRLTAASASHEPRQAQRPARGYDVDASVMSFQLHD